jgi:hypothetical protein
MGCDQTAKRSFSAAKIYVLLMSEILFFSDNTSD